GAYEELPRPVEIDRNCERASIPGRRDDPWHRDALRISQQFLALFDGDRTSRGDLAPLLTDSAHLPARESGAKSVRLALLRSYLSLDESGFQPLAVAPGQVVIDPYGELCLVKEPAQRPSKRWLSEQEFEGTRTIGEAR